MALQLKGLSKTIGAIMECHNNTRKADLNASRRLFLVDIKNATGKAMITEEDVTAVRRWANSALSIGGGDLVVVGTSSDQNCLAAMMSWQGVRHTLRRGHNGADLALAHALGEYRLSTFGEVVVLSGDGDFTEVVDAIAAAGCIATIVSTASSLSGRLARHATRVRLVSRSELAAA